jgi:hypothetical protein
MKDTRIFLLALAAFLLILPSELFAQTTFPIFNPPPCDFSDNFYTQNGFDLSNLNTAAAGRFGNFRQTGPPAFLPNQLNWVNDTSCSPNDPTRRNVRILATTAAYKDNDGAPTEFLSIIAFLLNQNFFTGGARATPNVRGFTTQQIVANFEAYVALTQNVNGVLAPTPCGSLHDRSLAAQPCFPVTSVATPNLRHDWRVASNRNAIDGSSNGPNTPFGYFCDDLTGSWIVTYFWYTQFSVGGVDTHGNRINPTPTCQNILSAAAAQNGNSLDGTPIIHTGSELHFLEGVAQASECEVSTSNCLFGLPLSAQPPPTSPCGNEGNLDVGGADGGAVWLICPTILDPRNGAIAQDSFLDVVRIPGTGGRKLDPRFADNFACLQQTGQFPSGGVCQGNPSATASMVP